MVVVGAGGGGAVVVVVGRRRWRLRVVVGAAVEKPFSFVVVDDEVPSFSFVVVDDDALIFVCSS